MRAMWSGAIAFGLVNIPVKLYTASEEHGLNLTMLHKADHSPIRFARICRSDGKEIPYEDIVKGYEYQKGDFVVLTDKDFEKANVRTSHVIDIVEFSDIDEIDVRYFEKPYYLEPEAGAEKAYALLREALKKSKKIAVAKFVLHKREHLGIVKPFADVLVLNQMRFSSELRSPQELNLPSNELVENKEVEMALALIKQLSRNFSAKEFHDTYIEDLEKIIAAKTKGKKIVAKGKIPAKTSAKNLMDTLKASLTKAARKKHAA